MSSADWWTGYGYEIPTLQRAAIRILSQPCSLHWCRWNRSTFDGVYDKKREGLELEKFCDLLYVRCNLWLRATISKDGKCKPINFDEIDVDAEWPTETEVPPCAHLDDSWLHTSPLEGKGIPSFSEFIYK